MSTQFLTPAARQVEARLGSDNTSNLDAFTRQVAVTTIEAHGFASSDYIFTAERRNDLAGNAVLGPKRLHLGKYSEAQLYGASGSPIPRFRFALRALASNAVKISMLDPDAVEYAHQVALFWADIGKLKDFLSVTPVISEIVAELRTARYQMLGKDTPVVFIKAVAEGLNLVASAPRFDTELVDSMVETMERGGFDSFAPNALKSSDE